MHNVCVLIFAFLYEFYIVYSFSVHVKLTASYRIVFDSKPRRLFAFRLACVGYRYMYALSTYTSAYRPTTCCTTMWLKPSEVEYRLRRVLILYSLKSLDGSAEWICWIPFRTHCF